MDMNIFYAMNINNRTVLIVVVTIHCSIKNIFAVDKTWQKVLLMLLYYIMPLFIIYSELIKKYRKKCQGGFYFLLVYFMSGRLALLSVIQFSNIQTLSLICGENFKTLLWFCMKCLKCIMLFHIIFQIARFIVLFRMKKCSY